MSDAKSSSATATTGTADPGRAYRGRFAPSPSGALHFGSLVAAVGSFLDARAHGGCWLVRIEDLDPPRERPGAADDILRTLERFGLHWDEDVLRQSTRADAYQAALARLAESGALRTCVCTRTQLADLPQNQCRTPGDELFHPSECLAPVTAAPVLPALRLRSPDRDVEFVDQVQGVQRSNVARTVGDFVLKRRDGPYAYQLAVVVDDAEQAITNVVRGADLLASTARQIVLQDALRLPHPAYMHLPIAVGTTGLKLSKSEDAPGLSRSSPAAQLVAVLEFLRQAPPPDLGQASLDELWRWAIDHWHPRHCAGVTTDTLPHTWGVRAQRGNAE